MIINDKEYIPTLEQRNKCPVCGHIQQCPCVHCKSRIDSTIKTWEWVNGELIKCAGCGLTMHVDKWELWTQNCWEKKENE